MEDDIDTHHHDKKIKLQGEDIPKSQNAADKMKPEEENIPKIHDGTNTVNSEVPQPRQKYIIYMSFRVVSYLISINEDPNIFYRSLMNDVGSCETHIWSRLRTPIYFVANLTPEEARKMSVQEDTYCNRRLRKFMFNL